MSHIEKGNPASVSAKHPRIIKKVLRTCVLLGVVALAITIVGQQLKQWRQPTRVVWGQVSQGDPEDKVRRMLGVPRLEYTRANSPPSYYVDGYGKPSRGITSRVLIYFGSDMVLYVWLDENGRVEETFIAGS